MLRSFLRTTLFKTIAKANRKKQDIRLAETSLTPVTSDTENISGQKNRRNVDGCIHSPKRFLFITVLSHGTCKGQSKDNYRLPGCSLAMRQRTVREDLRSKHHKDLPKSVESVGATASFNWLEVDFYDNFRDHLELQQTVLQCLS